MFAILCLQWIFSISQYLTLQPPKSSTASFTISSKEILTGITTISAASHMPIKLITGFEHAPRIHYHICLRNFHSSRFRIAAIYLHNLYLILHTCRNDYWGLYTYHFVFTDVKNSIICDFEKLPTWYYNFLVPQISYSTLVHSVSLLHYRNLPDECFWQMDSKQSIE